MAHYHKRALHIRNFRARANFPPPTIATSKLILTTTCLYRLSRLATAIPRNDKACFLSTQRLIRKSVLGTNGVVTHSFRLRFCTEFFVQERQLLPYIPVFRSRYFSEVDHPDASQNVECACGWSPSKTPHKMFRRVVIGVEC